MGNTDNKINKLSIGAFVISLTSLALSIVSLVCADSSTVPVETLITILSILVTVLVCWNIYSIIDMKDSIKRIDDIEKLCDKEFKYLRNELSNKQDKKRHYKYLSQDQQ